MPRAVLNQDGVLTVQYDLDVCPEFDVATPELMATPWLERARPLWVAWTFSAPPAIGSRVYVTIDGFKLATVRSYFHGYGFVGIQVECDVLPDWYVQQNKGQYRRPMVFGSEIRQLQEGEV